MSRGICKRAGRLLFEHLFVRRPVMLQDEAEHEFNDYADHKKPAIYVVVCSVIYYKVADGIERSKISFDDRLTQTLHTIESIRTKIPNAKILLVEGGTKDVSDILEKYVDVYMYLGNIKRVQKAVSYKNKGMGEVVMLIEAYRKIRDADFVFKISGRYFLNDHFCMKDIDLTRFNFVNYLKNGQKACGKWTWIEGSHSTRLMGFPEKYRKKMICALRLSKLGLYQGVSLESVLPFWLRKSEFNYLLEIGVSGQTGNSDDNVIYSE